MGKFVEFCGRCNSVASVIFEDCHKTSKIDCWTLNAERWKLNLCIVLGRTLQSPSLQQDTTPKVHGSPRASHSILLFNMRFSNPIAHRRYSSPQRPLPTPESTRRPSMPSLFNIVRACIYGMRFRRTFRYKLWRIIASVCLFTLICLSMAGHFQQVLAVSDLSEPQIVCHTEESNQGLSSFCSIRYFRLFGQFVHRCDAVSRLTQRRALKPFMLLPVWVPASSWEKEIPSLPGWSWHV
jgi:hypothetical protein